MTKTQFYDKACDSHMKMRLLLEGAIKLLEDDTFAILPIENTEARIAFDAMSEALFEVRRLVKELQTTVV